MHRDLSRVDLSDCAKLLRLGTRLWREGRRDRDVEENEDDANDTRRGVTVWTPEVVQASLEWLGLRAALARRRAIWLTRLFDSSVVWREPDDSSARLMVIENGEVVLREAGDAHATPPIPPGYHRRVTARREAFALASFDRLRVLTTELKRLIAAGAPVALRLGVGPALDGSRLASALWWGGWPPVRNQEVRVLGEESTGWVPQPPFSTRTSTPFMRRSNSCLTLACAASRLRSAAALCSRPPTKTGAFA